MQMTLKKRWADNHDPLTAEREGTPWPRRTRGTAGAPGVTAPGIPSGAFPRSTLVRPGAEGSERIAPPARLSQGNSGIPLGGIQSQASGRFLSGSHRLSRAPAPVGRRGSDGRGGLTPFSGPSYHPPDDDAPRALGRRRVCVPLWGADDPSPRGRMERIPDSPDDQADLPAQEAPPRQGARLPRPDEDDAGTSRARRSARSRSQTARGLTDRRGTQAPRLVMLSRPREFAAFEGAGTTRSNQLLTARFLRTDLGMTRFGLATGRKLGTAVIRNRVRRRLRGALRVMAPSFQPGWDVLIIARPAIVEADHDALVGALRRTLVRGGVLGGPSAT